MTDTNPIKYAFGLFETIGADAAVDRLIEEGGDPLRTITAAGGMMYCLFAEFDMDPDTIWKACANYKWEEDRQEALDELLADIGMEYYDEKK